MNNSKYTESKTGFSDGESMDEENLLEQAPPETKKRGSLRDRFLRAAVLHATILIFYSMILIAIVQSLKEDRIHGPGVIYSQYQFLLALSYG
jgi:hypothetical protein